MPSIARLFRSSAMRQDALAGCDGHTCAAADYICNPEAHALLGDTFAASDDAAAAKTEYAAGLHSSELDPVFQASLLARLQSMVAR